MNKVILMGRLARDPEVRVTPSGKHVCSFTLAVNRPFVNQANGQKEADFISIVVWGKAAELCGNSLGKGHRLLVNGRLQIRNYIASDGAKKYVTEIIANQIELIEARKQSENLFDDKKDQADGFISSDSFDEEGPF